MIYRKILIVAAIIAAACGNLMAADEQQPVDRFADACILMHDAMQNKDRYALMDAREIFSSVKADLFEDYEVVSGKVEKPDIQLNEAYCDTLLMHGFELIRLKELSGLRGNDEPAKVQQFALQLKPGAEITLRYYSANRCALAIVGMGEKFPKLDLKADGKSIDFKTKGGRMAKADWTMPDEFLPVDISLTNTDSSPTIVAIAIQ